MKILLCADKWGVAPWVIESHPDAMEWMTKQLILDMEFAKATEKK